ncbi:MAG TPA: hypothetical protein VFK20_04860 [Vicinamibacterales bacterium]|nr:hypothetical protein [Vicinamibacterales bacterium]
MSRPGLFGLAFVVTLAVGGQSLLGRSPSPTAADQAKAAQEAAGPFDTLHFRPIGPASMSGRISDLAVYESNPAIFYVGTAHGGVWKTTNNGTTFEPQFQTDGLMSIGDVTVSQSNPDLVWVGTGESNNRQSGSWGDGVFKSTDGGKTFTAMGLRASRHINRIVIDPRDNDVVLVAATGSLWGPGGDRGVYRTTDGGRTWTQVLKTDEDTGANDLVMDPSDHNVLYASTYQRRRTACCVNGGGPGSGIWKSTDNGATWTRLTKGLPEGSLGRIGLDVSRSRPDILYALIEGPVDPDARGGFGGGRRGAPAQGVDKTPTGLYRSDDAGASWRKVNNVNPRPLYFSQVRVDPNDAEVIYLGGVGLHQSTDGGRTVYTDVAESTHDDVHAIWIDPENSRHVIIGNDGGLAASYDMAKTWAFYPNLPVGLFYHVSYDMATPYNVCGGMQDNYDWCGPSAVRGAPGIANHHWMTLQGGDGFVVLQDPHDYRIAYSESQDGNMVRADRITGETMSIRPRAAKGEPDLRWNWDTPLVMSPHDPKVVYAAANRVYKSADRGQSWTPISPDLTGNASRDDIATMGVNGKEVRIAKNDGISAWPTIVSFAESPKRAGLLYAGTDDGHLQVSRDAGRTWKDVIDRVKGVPEGIYVSEIVPSRFDEGTVYATFDGHRGNDFTTHLYASRDEGQTWQSINGGLSDEVARTLTEDLKNPDVLYLGTETGLFVTVDRGRTWTRIKANLPTVRIDEIVLHPRDNAMILATHGRALWILDHLEPVQEYARAAQTEAALFSMAPSAMYRRPARDRNYEFWGDQTFFGENPPQAALVSWYLAKPAKSVELKITDATGHDVRQIGSDVLAKSTGAGIHAACWDLRVEPVPMPARPENARGSRGAGAANETDDDDEPASPFGAGCDSGGGGGFGRGGNARTSPGPWVLPGVYSIALVVDGRTIDTKPLRVTADPEVALTQAERKKMFDMAMELHALQRQATEAADQLAPLQARLSDLTKDTAERSDLPAEVKTSIEELKKDVAALAARIVPPAGGRGFGRGNTDNIAVRLGMTKNALMGGMWPTSDTLAAYADAKVDVPKAAADVKELLTRASTLDTTLTKYNLQLVNW